MTVLVVLQQAGGSTARRDLFTDERSIAAATVALALLVIVFALLGRFVRSAEVEPPRIETHWGGLGGGLGGWRISASLGYLVALLAFGGMFTAFAIRWILPPPGGEKPAAAVSTKGGNPVTRPPTQPTTPADSTRPRDSTAATS